MIPEVVTQLPSLGIAGLLFVMWWVERQERNRAASSLHDALRHVGHVADVNERLLQVVQANTEALTALREALHHQRDTQVDWLTRLTQQIDELASADA